MPVSEWLKQRIQKSVENARTERRAAISHKAELREQFRKGEIEGAYQRGKNAGSGRVNTQHQPQPQTHKRYPNRSTSNRNFSNAGYGIFGDTMGLSGGSFGGALALENNGDFIMPASNRKKQLDFF